MKDVNKTIENDSNESSNQQPTLENFEIQSKFSIIKKFANDYLTSNEVAAMIQPDWTHYELCKFLIQRKFIFETSFRINHLGIISLDREESVFFSEIILPKEIVPVLVKSFYFMIEEQAMSDYMDNEISSRIEMFESERSDFEKLFIKINRECEEELPAEEHPLY